MKFFYAAAALGPLFTFLVLQQSFIAQPVAGIDQVAFNSILANLTLALLRAIPEALNEVPKAASKDADTTTTTEVTTESTTTTEKPTTKKKASSAALPETMAVGNITTNITLNADEVHAVVALLGQLGLGSLLNSVTAAPVANRTATESSNSSSNSTAHPLAKLTTVKPKCDPGALCNMFTPCTAPCKCSNVQNPRIAGRCFEDVPAGAPPPSVFMG